ncbi:MAG: polysaccharide pyruvyl transferase family protein, partial [Sphingobacteriaceae bacterium]
SVAPVWFIDAISNPQVDRKLSAVSSKSFNSTILSELLSGNKNGEKRHIYYVVAPGHRSTSGLTSARRTLLGGIKNYIFKLFGGRMIRMGFSIGPFDKLNAKAESIISGNYYYYGLRDHKSMALAKSLNFSDPQYFPDLAWCYKPYPEDPATARVDKNYVVLSFRSNEYGTAHNEDYLAPIVNKIKALLKTVSTQKIVLAYQVQYDREAAVYIQQQIGNEYETELVDHKLLLPEAEALYRNAKLVISNRLHVLMLAFQCDTLAIPLINLEDNKKIVGIYADNGMGNIILDSDQDIALLETSLNNIVAAEEKHIQLFKDAAKRNTDLMREKLDGIFNS